MRAVLTGEIFYNAVEIEALKRASSALALRLEDNLNLSTESREKKKKKSMAGKNRHPSTFFRSPLFSKTFIFFPSVRDPQQAGRLAYYRD